MNPLSPDRVFFTDRDLGHQFPRILIDAGIATEIHDMHFGQDTTDDVWIGEVAARGWIAITHDDKIRRAHLERKAVLEARLALLIVRGKAPFSDLARNFVRTFSRIQAFLDENPPPVIGKVYRPPRNVDPESELVPGRVVCIFPRKD